MKSQTVLVDLDGVLARNELPWQGPDTIEEPRPNAKAFLAVLCGAGLRVVVWTCRDKLVACRWLHEHGMMPYVDEIRDDKTPFLVVVDDRAIDGRGDLQAIVDEIVTRRRQ